MSIPANCLTALAVRIARDPLGAGFLILLFYGGPRNAVSDLFETLRFAIPILDPGVIEGTQIYFLRVLRQMRPN